MVGIPRIPANHLQAATTMKDDDDDADDVIALS